MKMQKFLFNSLAAGLAVTASAAWAGPVSVPLFYTTFSGGQNVWRIDAAYTGNGTAGNGAFSLTGDTFLHSTSGADGIVLNPNNNRLLIGGQGDAIHEVDKTPGGTINTVAPGINAFHLAVDPSKNIVWASSIPGALSSTSINPNLNGTGTILSLTGDTSAITSLAFVPGLGTYEGNHKVFFTDAGPGGFGQFGTIDLLTGVTTVLQNNVEAAHGMVYDPFSGKLILLGGTEIAMIDPNTPGSIFDSKTFAGLAFDQGAVDGNGHLFFASNTGSMLFMDYSTTGKVSDVNNFVANPFLKASLDDIAPLIGAGGTNTTVPEPTSLALFAIGAAGFLPRLARREKKQGV